MIRVSTAPPTTATTAPQRPTVTARSQNCHSSRACLPCASRAGLPGLAADGARKGAPLIRFREARREDASPPTVHGGPILGETHRGSRARGRGRLGPSDAPAALTELDRQLFTVVSSQRVLNQTKLERLFAAGKWPAAALPFARVRSATAVGTAARSGAASPAVGRS